MEDQSRDDAAYLKSLRQTAGLDLAELAALAKRIPSVAHRKNGNDMLDVALADIAVGDLLVIYPHETCPADGIVIEGHGVMDESYLTGEPFSMTKTSGSTVMSGAINGESALTFRTSRRATPCLPLSALPPGRPIASA